MPIFTGRWQWNYFDIGITGPPSPQQHEAGEMRFHKFRFYITGNHDEIDNMVHLGQLKLFSDRSILKY